MYKNQGSLPRLPVPDLDGTVDGFLEASEALFIGEDDVWRKTKAAAGQLRGQAGKELQQRLRARAASPDVPNWLEEWWFDAYLTDRGPIPNHVSPAFVWGRDPHGCMTQVARATKIVCGALRMRKEILSATYAPESVRGEPLCMDEYRNLFAACRVPGKARDTLVSFEAQRPTHVVIIASGRLYTADVCEQDGTPFDRVRISATLEACRRHAADHPATCRPAVLTGWTRPEWAAARGVLRSSPAGAAAVDRIESALFSVVLDEHSPAHESGATGKHFMHGRGGDRWFDKSFNVIVCANGVAGLIFEHTGTDALPPLKVADYAFADATPYPEGAPAPGGLGANGAAEVVLPVAAVAAEIRAAEQHTLAEHKAVDMEWLSLPEYSDAKLRAISGVSPDAFVQLALQLAWRRVRGLPAPSTYEAGSMKTFVHGRTETVRPVTPESVAFVDVFCDAKSAPTDRSAALRAGMRGHIRALKRVKAGKGVDRHLLGLRILAASDAAQPDLFSDPGFRRFAHIDLSTSNPQGSTHAGAVLNAVFGPVTPTGVGACYLVHRDRLIVAITTFNGTATSFALAFEQACKEMLAVLKPAGAKL